METIKKWEDFSIFLAVAVAYTGLFLKSIPIALLIFTFGLFVQGYIFYGYKKNNMQQEYLKKKLGGILLVAFFLFKDGI
jgi:hypothetical protein